MADAWWATLSTDVGWVLVVVSLVRAGWMAFCCPASLATRCPGCGYPVDPRVGLRCAECGAEAPAVMELHLRRWGRGSYVLVGCSLVCGVVCIAVVPRVVREGWRSCVPNLVLVRWGPMLGTGAEAELYRRVGDGTLDAAERVALVDACVGVLESRSSGVDHQRALGIGRAVIDCEDLTGWRVVRAAMRDRSERVRRDAIAAVDISDARCPAGMVDELCGVVESDADTETRVAALVRLHRRSYGKDDLLTRVLSTALRSENKLVALYAADIAEDKAVAPYGLYTEVVMLARDQDPWRKRLARYVLTGDNRLLAELSAEVQRSEVARPVRGP